MNVSLFYRCFPKFLAKWKLMPNVGDNAENSQWRTLTHTACKANRSRANWMANFSRVRAPALISTCRLEMWVAHELHISCVSAILSFRTNCLDSDFRSLIPAPLTCELGPGKTDGARVSFLAWTQPLGFEKLTRRWRFRSKTKWNTESGIVPRAPVNPLHDWGLMEMSVTQP